VIESEPAETIVGAGGGSGYLAACTWLTGLHSLQPITFAARYRSR